MLRKMFRRGWAWGLTLALLLAVAAGAQAAPERQCSIQADSTRELYDSLTGAAWSQRSAETQARLWQSFPGESEKDYELSYELVENVTIQAGDQRMPLEEAISTGAVSVEEILASVRRDAAAKVCWEFVRTKNGLTKFAYCYPDYNLIFCNDVLEAPDGTDRLIRYFQVTAPGVPSEMDTGIIDWSSPYHYCIDREDWGLEFQVTSAGRQGVTLEITQTGGQQFGQLTVESSTLYTDGDWNDLCNVPFAPHQALHMGGVSTLEISWDAVSGQLPEPGDYCLALRLHDEFEPGDVHPLARDFHTSQTYYVTFQIT